MKSNNNLTILIVIIIFALIACCCMVTLVVSSILTGLIPATLFDLPVGMQMQRTVESYDLARDTSVEVDNFAGNVQVCGGETNQLELVAVRHADAFDDMDDIKVSIRRQSGKFIIETTHPRNMHNASVNLQITVPRQTALNLYTGAGDVDVCNIAAEVVAKTAAGSMEVRDVDGRVQLFSAAGSLTLGEINGDVDVETNAGSIDLIGIAGDTIGYTRSGSIEMRDAAGVAQLKTGAGSITYQGEPAGDTSFETGSGSIDLSLPTNLSAELSLRAPAGRVILDYPAVDGEVSDRQVQGTVGGDPTCSITAYTGAGTITMSAY